MQEVFTNIHLNKTTKYFRWYLVYLIIHTSNFHYLEHLQRKKYPPLILLNVFNRIKHRNTFTVCVCKLQIYKGSMTVYKAFQKRLQAFQYCWLSHFPYVCPSPPQTSRRHNYLCGIPNYLITDPSYVMHAGSHTCRLTICLERNVASVKHSKNSLRGLLVIVRTEYWHRELSVLLQ